MRTILVVDDERDLVATCVRLLGRQGYDADAKRVLTREARGHEI